jgi:hypothetical protein
VLLQVVEQSQMSRPSVDDGQLFAEPHGIGRRVRFKLLAKPAAAYDDACLPVPAEQDAQPSGFEVERAGIPAAGQRVPCDNEFVLTSLQPVGGVHDNAAGGEAALGADGVDRSGSDLSVRVVLAGAGERPNRGGREPGWSVL